MSKIQDILKKISMEPNFIIKFQKAQSFKEFHNLYQEIDPSVTQKEVENQIIKLSQLNDNKLEKISGGKVNFNKIKILAIAALLPIFITNFHGTVHAGNTSSSAKQSIEEYSEISFQIFEQEQKEARETRRCLGIIMEDACYSDNYDLRKLYREYNKLYAPDDMARIHRGIFDVSKYFTQFGTNRALCGPWRQIALKKSKKDSQFKNVLSEMRKRQQELDEMFAELASLKTGDGIPDLVKAPPERELICIVTDNEVFEKFVGTCRIEWNKIHPYMGWQVKSHEDALRKALFILRPATKGEDPFHNRIVKVLHDPARKIYLVQKTVDSRIRMRSVADDHGVDFVLLHEDGEVLAIDAGESVLRALI